jgi:hypothetical protein
MAPDWLLTDQRAMYVEGIGHLDQYGSYIDTLWEKGVVYFLRDYLFNDIQLQLEKGVRPKELRPLIARLNALNSDLRVWEANGSTQNPAAGVHKARDELHN